MKLAAKGVELSACPYVTEEAKTALEAASAPPMKTVTVGEGDKAIEIGGETVMFRHDKTFLHEPGIFIRIKDTAPEAEIDQLVDKVSGYIVERVGQELSCNGFAIENASKDTAAFKKVVERVAARTGWPVVLMSSSPEALEAALPAVHNRKPVIYAATKDNWQAMANLAKSYNASLVVSQDEDLSTLASLVEELTKAGVEDVVLDPVARSLGGNLRKLTILRRLALRKNVRLVGYPIITFPGDGASSPQEETLGAAQHIAKYSSLIVMDNFDPSLIYPLLTLRQNIYTDPQKPIQVKPDIYTVGEPTATSPLLITTNFSLTYFTVTGEVESSGVPSWVLVADSEGMSVLTAWAAGKFDAEKIAKTVKTSGIADKISHRKLVLPGYVSTLKGEVEDELPDWEILIGPREAVDITGYLRSWSA